MSFEPYRLMQLSPSQSALPNRRDPTQCALNGSVFKKDCLKVVIQKKILPIQAMLFLFPLLVRKQRAHSHDCKL